MTLRQQLTMHMRLGRGGYFYNYDLTNEAGEVVGQKTISRAHRSVEPKLVYSLGTAEFTSARALIAAYEAKVEADRYDREWEAAAP